jgi:hypothetical protein
MTVFIISKKDNTMRTVPANKVGIFFLGRDLKEYITIISNQQGDYLLQFANPNINTIQDTINKYL